MRVNAGRLRQVNLNKAFQRNRIRFPADFMFQISDEEFENLIFQFGRSSWGGRRTRPYAFTEQGVAMLSSVLRSKRAVLVNIEIMRAFVRLRQILATQPRSSLRPKRPSTFSSMRSSVFRIEDL